MGSTQRRINPSAGALLGYYAWRSRSEKASASGRTSVDQSHWLNNRNLRPNVRKSSATPPLLDT